MSVTLNKTFHSQVDTYLDSIREDKCCTVIALAIVTGEPLDKCFKFMSLCGREDRKGMSSKKLEVAFLKSKKYKFIHRKFEKPKTIKQFVKDHSVGTYYVCVRGHAFAIIDGVVFDHTDKPLRRIKEAWRVYKKECN